MTTTDGSSDEPKSSLKPGPGPQPLPEGGASPAPRQAGTAEALAPDRSTGRLARFGWPVLVVALTYVYALVPFVVGSSNFYRRGDSASQFIPTWFHLGDLLRGGSWPPVLDPDSWYGGNYPAEALFGIYNPVNAINWVFVSLLPNLDLAATLVKAEFLAILALGLYLLCREYGAKPWAASVVAVAMPFAGFTLYWDAASWASGLSAFMYMPHVWWAFRKTSRGRLNPVWAFVIGALAITQGNPYGTLGVVLVGVGLLVELLVERNWSAVRRLLITGACTAAWLPLVYLPLLATEPLAHRSQLAALSNNDMMSPNIGDLLNLSAPTYLPNIPTFVDPMQVPAAYFAWFVLPLLPWLRWSTLRGRMSTLAGILTVVVAYALFTLGPSSLWLFRWPLRLVEYLELALGLFFCLLLSAGLARDRVKQRGVASLALVLAGGFVSWSQTPNQYRLHVVATILVVFLVTAVLYAARRWGSLVPLVATLQAGTLVVLVLQAHAYPQNRSAGVWDFPSSVSAMEDRFDSRYTGTTIQFADLIPIRAQVMKHGPAGWHNLLAGSLYHAVGVTSVNTYSGLGYDAFTHALCMDFKGGTRPCGYSNLFKPTELGRPDLANLMKVNTIVVQRGLLKKLVVHPGWQVAEHDQQVIVLHPTHPLPYPGSRLSWVSSGVHVTTATSVSATQESVHVRVDAPGQQTLIFARIAWPGYSAQLDGHDLDVTHTDAGLLEVHLPPGTSAGEVTVDFRPPGQPIGLVLAGVAFLVSLAWGVLVVVRRRLPESGATALPAGSAPSPVAGG